MRRRIAGLHQQNTLSNKQIEVVDQENNKFKRYVICMEMVLSLEPIDENHYGYQPPLPPQAMGQFKPYHGRNTRGGGDRGGGGTSRQNLSRNTRTGVCSPPRPTKRADSA